MFDFTETDFYTESMGIGLKKQFLAHMQLSGYLTNYKKGSKRLEKGVTTIAMLLVGGMG